MTQPFRLPSGGQIRRDRPLTFRFDGRELHGYEGDTLASALLANGIRIVGRSFKYHRPRGIFSAGVEEPNALVQLDGVPNVRATLEPLREGLVARSQNAWPSVRWDVSAAIGVFATLLPAGFYYKTFRWPAWAWFEPFIRRLVGLGVAPAHPDTNRYDERDARVEVLVVGGGAAGLAAAIAAARAGARTMLLEAEPHLGGGLRWCGKESLSQHKGEQLASLIAAAATTPGLRVLLRTLAIGWYDHNLIAAVEQVGGESAAIERLWRIRARHVIVATGAIERPPVFPDNDRPGVMLASAVRRYLAQYAVAPGRRAAIYASDTSGYQAALDLHAAGVSVAAVIDPRASGDAQLTPLLQERNIPLIAGAAIVRVAGRRGVKAVEVAPLREDTLSRRRAFDCDLLAVSAGWTPTVHLYSHAGGPLLYDNALQCFRPEQERRPEMSVVGGASGRFVIDEALTDAAHVGEAMALGKTPAGLRAAAASAPQTITEVPLSGRASRRPQFVDLQGDVTAADVHLAAREGYRCVEHLKRYTTIGMAPDQGKTSNVNALAILAQATARSTAEVGTTRFRPPYAPVSFGALAGHRRGALLKPSRYMPAHEWHAARGAKFEEYGEWHRPAFYALPGEDPKRAAQRECLAVRTSAGVFESSPLGKVDVAGADAAEFLDRMYVQSISNLQSGRIRYGAMLNEYGIIIDDGVCVRLAADRFLVSTTSGGANRIAAALDEWLQCEWVDLRVVVTNVTEQWGSVTLSGPKARTILQRLGTDIDLGPQAFPHLSVREGSVNGMCARILRVSFTGECSYEINVPARRTVDLLDALAAAGGSDLTPYGVDALMILRTEKGFLHVGGDTDGTTMPHDVGLAGGVSRKVSDFVGRRSLLLPAALDPNRLQLVGLRSVEPAVVLPVGAQVPGGEQGAGSQGHVTSSCFSPTLGRSIALGMLRGGRARFGEKLVLRARGHTYAAEVVAVTAFDPEGTRLRA